MTDQEAATLVTHMFNGTLKPEVYAIVGPAYRKRLNYTDEEGALRDPTLDEVRAHFGREFVNAINEHRRKTHLAAHTDWEFADMATE